MSRPITVKEYVEACKKFERGKKQREEQALQKAVCEFLEVALPRGVALFFSVPNGGWRTKAEAGILKATGLKAGVSDLVFLWTRPGFVRPAVGFIELKAGRGVLSDDQRAFAKSCKAIGAHWAEARSVTEVEMTLRRWGVPLRSQPFGGRTVMEAA